MKKEENLDKKEENLEKKEENLHPSDNGNENEPPKAGTSFVCACSLNELRTSQEHENTRNYNLGHLTIFCEF